MVTTGVSALGPRFLEAALAAVATYDRFDHASDPYGEHDFGALVVVGVRLLWKIDPRGRGPGWSRNACWRAARRAPARGIRPAATRASRAGGRRAGRPRGRPAPAPCASPHCRGRGR